MVRAEEVEWDEDEGLRMRMNGLERWEKWHRETTRTVKGSSDQYFLPLALAPQRI